MEEKKDKTIKEEKKKKEVKLSFDNYRHLKVFGVSLLIITTIIILLVSFILLIRYSESLQNIVIGEKEQENQESINITVTPEESIIINVVKETSPSVVSVAVSQLALRSGEGLVDEVSNIGTGFIVDSNGIIVTNQHVVSDIAATYKVVTNDGKEYEVIEILRDDSNDIAILKIDATSLKAIELGDSDSIVVGQTVIAIGNPLGAYEGTVTTGVISGKNRSVTTSTGWFGSTTKVYEDVIQTDAAVNPGNSGGPLINTEGKVVGVAFATTSNADNISFALPINRVKLRLDEYRTYGKFIKPYIGISYRMISDYEAMYYRDVVAGALVMSVDASGPGAKTNISRGDIITKVEDKVVNQSFAYIIQSYEVGQEISLEVWNAGETRTVKVTLEEAD